MRCAHGSNPPPLDEAQSGLRPLLIGQDAGTGRLAALAEKYDAEIYQPATKAATRSENIQMNLDWLMKAVRQGRQVLDAGPIPGFPESDYYNAETGLLDAVNYYSNWISIAP